MKRIKSKTVYFRVAGSGGTGTAITIPAYTELETDENGNYIEGASGTKYKKAITFQNRNGRRADHYRCAPLCSRV